MLRHGATKIWLDAGPGTLAALQEHTAPDGLDAVWISHLHADHVADLFLCEANNGEANNGEADSDEPSAAHLTPAEAGRAATGAARLLLTHVGHTITARDAVTQAAEHFPGPVAYAAPRAVYGV